MSGNIDHILQRLVKIMARIPTYCNKISKVALRLMAIGSLFSSGSFVHDDCFPVTKGRQTPKEINDEILRMGKQEADTKRREKNLEDLRTYLQQT